MPCYVGAKLHGGQQRIASAIIGTPHTEGSVDYHIVTCSRQWGKSFMLLQLILYYALNEANSKILFVSMSYSQANKIFHELIRGVESSNVIRKKNASENSIILLNGSEIYIRSYQRSDLIRGLSATTLIIDEAAFVKDEDWQAVLRPTLATAGKRGILFSTPRGHNFFYEMAVKGQSPEWSNYHFYHSTYRENPYANLQEVSDAERSLPDKIFRAEYEAEFVSGSLSVFTNYRNCLTGKHTAGKKIAGVDVGNADDWTVLTIMDGNKVIGQWRWRHDTFENIIREIVTLLAKHNVYKCFVEVNGLGSPFFEFLNREVRTRRLRVQIEPWTTTNNTKQNIIEQLINDFAMNNIIIPDEAELLLELDNFECTYSGKSKSIIYGGASGVHDDCVMSLAICNYNRVVNVPSGAYHIRMV